jgi:hypothetical protein
MVRLDGNEFSEEPKMVSSVQNLPSASDIKKIENCQRFAN